MTSATKENGHGILARESRPEHLDSFFRDSFFRNFFEPREFWPSWALRPLRAERMGFEIDMYKADGQYIIECSLPGFKKDEIRAEFHGTRLTISAEHAKVSGEDSAKYVYRERQSGVYYRTIDFGEPIDPKNVVAKYVDGILKVSVPIPAAETTKQIPIGS